MGRKMLVAILQRTRAKYVAATCRVSPSTVSRWASGECRPKERVRIVLEQRYRIPRVAWDQPHGSLPA